MNTHVKVNDLVLCVTEDVKRNTVSYDSFEAKFTEAMAIDDLSLKVATSSAFKGMLPEEKALHKFMKNEGLKLFVSDRANSEMFVNAPSGFAAVIMLEKDLKEETPNVRLVTLAHELGHYIDYSRNFACDSDAFGEETLDFDSEIITEAVAWSYAYDMLAVLGYNNWECFFDVALDALTSYTYDAELADHLLHNMERVKAKREIVHLMYMH